MRQGCLDTLTHRDNSSVRPPGCARPGVLDGEDTEAGMLSGISRERSIRSSPYWFTEFCNSQCSSHFAAPFIVVRAETSVAESCKINSRGQPLLKICAEQTNAGSKTHGSRTRARRTFRPGPTALEVLRGGIDAISIPAQTLTQVYSQ